MRCLPGISHTSSLAQAYKIAYSYGYYELKGFGGQDKPYWMHSIYIFSLLTAPFFCLAVFFRSTRFKPADQALQQDSIKTTCSYFRGKCRFFSYKHRVYLPLKKVIYLSTYFSHHTIKLQQKYIMLKIFHFRGRFHPIWLQVSR